MVIERVTNRYNTVEPLVIIRRFGDMGANKISKKNANQGGISVENLNQLEETLRSLSGEDAHLEPVEFTPNEFAETLLSYTKSEGWEQFSSVYSRMITAEPRFNLKKIGLRPVEFLNQCSEFIEIEERFDKYHTNKFEWIRARTEPGQGDPRLVSSEKKVQRREPPRLGGGDSEGLVTRWVLRPISRMLSQRIRVLEKNLRGVSDKNERLSSDNSSLESDVSGLSTERDKWKKRHDSLRKEKRDEEYESKDSYIQSLREKITVLERENDNLNSRLEEASVIVSESHPRDPESVLDAVEWAEGKFDTLLFFDDARKSAKNSPYHSPSRVLETLGKMDKTGKKWFRLKAGFSSYESLLRDEWSLNIAESDSVKREFGTINAKGEWLNVEMQSHIKFGVQMDPRKTLRIYYIASREHERIFIGWCGQHP